LRGKATKKYLQSSKKRFDPFSLLVSFGLIIIVLIAMGMHGGEAKKDFFDLPSAVLIFGGTLASLLFQFDFSATFSSIQLVFKSFLGTPDRHIVLTIRQLDEAILKDRSLIELREGSDLNGDLLNDVIYMYKNGLLYEEIEDFVTTRISTEFLNRQTAVTMLKRASGISPALGLFGTVVGLIGVLKSLSNPAAIGPSMSLALMTTAYGAGMSSLLFTPLAGRLDHHNVIFLESHKQLMTKVGILLNREERKIEDPMKKKLESA
jgi:chemotaxis protein MotA